ADKPSNRINPVLGYNQSKNVAAKFPQFSVAPIKIVKINSELDGKDYDVIYVIKIQHNAKPIRHSLVKLQ
ncbi:20472_t:CDS:1, partial [Gigaspora margarita]